MIYTLRGKRPPLKAKYEGLFFGDLKKNPCSFEARVLGSILNIILHNSYYNSILSIIDIYKINSLPL